jgi:hypothetical protein
MSKVKIEDLENIVLEGGGAKGAVYLGAIRAIEEKLEKLYSDGSFGDKVPNAKAILDYGRNVNNKLEPQIKRFAGSSAGAITSFALALGLNSDQISEATKFPFDRFLQDHHVGLYRIIQESGRIGIGEDRGKSLGKGNQTKDYNFNLEKRHWVFQSPLKAQYRSFVMGLFKSGLVAGLLQVMADLKKLFEWITGLFKNSGDGDGILGFEPDEWGKWTFAFKRFYNILSKMGIVKTPTISNSPSQLVPSSPPSTHSPQFNMIAHKIVDQLIPIAFWHLSSKNKMNLSMDAIGNIFWDRGMFSGFAVREFFYDLLIYASVNDTHFHRCYFKNPDHREALLKLGKKMDIKHPDGRLRVDFSGLDSDLRDLLVELPEMTFREFFDATNVSLTLCVSNFSTDQPVYFSDITTPNFPVIEAVGASMSIPPAIKPVYNASNVMLQGEGATKLYMMDRAGNKTENDSPYYNFAQYEIDFVAIKQFLAEEFKLEIHSNNPMSFTGYQLLLCKYLQRTDAVNFSKKYTIEGISTTITYEHLVHHYNAAFKGLLLDGGYRCNIPYNVFRNFIFANDPTKEEIDPMFGKTIAIKLDKTFPKEWVMRMYKIFQLEAVDLGVGRMFDKRIRKVLANALKVAIETNSKWLKTDSDKLFDIEDVKHLKNLKDDSSFEHVADSVIETYERMIKKHRTPWNKQKSMLAVAGEGYAFGSEEGQIRYLSDHEHIIPLFSYGIGTYDFDLNSINGLVELSQKKAKAQTMEYFKQ